jgi:hypothetical protein
MKPADLREILRTGLLAWNDWRLRNPEVRVDLSDFDFRNIQASKTFPDPSPEWTHAIATRGLDLAYTVLTNANFSKMDLTEVDFRRADLGAADFSYTRLWRVNFDGADLRLANFAGASFAAVDWGGCDLRGAVGLDFATHTLPSTIDVRAIRRADLPSAFLMGCGLPVELRDYLPSLLDNASIARYSCFVSYSSVDDAFVERLHKDLQSAGIRCWFAPVEMRAGDRIRSRLDEAISLSEKLLVVLSRSSVDSQYVEEEVEAALEKERQKQQTVLLPLRIDRAIFDRPTGWTSYIRRTRHISDFSFWKDWSAYREAFEKLVRDIKQTTLSALDKPSVS